LRLLTTVSQLHHAQGGVPARCVCVPTMGALHAGHAALIRQASALAHERGMQAGCVVTIFVNPTQFNEPKDYQRYPRTLAADLELCKSAGASIVFAPGAAEVYPPGHEVPVPPLPSVATRPGLEDAFRPGHFAGVCQVVQRLFALVRPAAAIFGEKDWQQLAVIRAMVAHERSAVEVLGAHTVREPGGLAMSSRNRFLSPAQREQALAISQALCESWHAKNPADAERAMLRTLTAAGIKPEYAVVRDADTLEHPTPSTKHHRALIAARVGDVRLIDNAEWRCG
jgi:pantoate--beta-alanine ligase